ncbi:MAG: ABC transporter permease [Holophagales bacterium]|nr:MAG: ABC transporter permease [Holophagales bacterium]
MGDRWLLPAGLALVGLLFAAALVGPLLTPHSPDRQLDPVAGRNLPPGTTRWLVERTDGRTLLAERWETEPGGDLGLWRFDARRSLPAAEVHRDASGSPVRPVRFVLGTDRFGRDLAARLLAGARVSLGVGLAALALALTVGIAAGSLAALGGRAVDQIVMRGADALLAFPRLFLALAAAALLGPGIATVVTILGVTGWMGVARLVRAEILAAREREWALAARASGLSPWRIYFRHLLPNSLSPVFVDAALRLGDTILVEASLSFLGLGIQPPRASWGSLVADGRDVLGSAWWIAAFPGAAVAIAVLAFNLVGEGLRDRMDPRRAAGRRTS